MRSVFGTILDPAADKTLMTTLVVTLAYKGLLPSTFPLRGLPAARGTSILMILSWFFPFDMLATSIRTVNHHVRSAPRHPHPRPRRRTLPFGILVPLHLPPRTCKSRSDPLMRTRWTNHSIISVDCVTYVVENVQAVLGLLYPLGRGSTDPDLKGKSLTHIPSHNEVNHTS